MVRTCFVLCDIVEQMVDFREIAQATLQGKRSVHGPTSVLTAMFNRLGWTADAEVAIDRERDGGVFSFWTLGGGLLEDAVRTDLWIALCRKYMS